MYNFNNDNKPTPEMVVKFDPDPNTGLHRFFKSWIDLIEKPPEPIQLTLGEFFENVANVYGYDESYVTTMHEKYAPYLEYVISKPSFAPVGEELEKNDIIETEVTFTINDWVGKND